MPKIIVVIENTEDGQPIWDEASVKQLHDVVRSGTKPNHHQKRDDYGEVTPHYSGRQHQAADSTMRRHSADGSANGASHDEQNSDLEENSSNYQFEA